MSIYVVYDIYLNKKIYFVLYDDLFYHDSAIEY